MNILCLQHKIFASLAMRHLSTKATAYENNKIIYSLGLSCIQKWWPVADVGVWLIIGQATHSKPWAGHFCIMFYFHCPQNNTKVLHVKAGKTHPVGIFNCSRDRRHFCRFCIAYCISRTDDFDEREFTFKAYSCCDSCFSTSSRTFQKQCE